IDLGAAALYAKQFQQQESQTAGSSNANNNASDLIGITSSDNSNGLPAAAASTGGDLLADLFGDLSVNPNPPAATLDGSALSAMNNCNQADNVADFSQFNSSDNADEFTDFQCAFGPAASVNPAPSLFNSDSSLFPAS